MIHARCYYLKHSFLGVFFLCIDVWQLRFFAVCELILKKIKQERQKAEEEEEKQIRQIIDESAQRDTQYPYFSENLTLTKKSLLK